MTDRAAVIIRGLSGHHLHGFLPGNDHKQAVSHAVGGGHTWTVASGVSGHVTSRGIGLYANATSPRLVAPPPLLLVTWRELLEIVATGCGYGLREEYEAALAELMAWTHDAHDYAPGGTPPPVDHERYALVTDGLHRTTAAIITAGCQPVAAEFRADQLALAL